MRALVISGGGSKGAFAGGVAQYLIEKEGREYDMFLGTSTGSLLISHLALNKIDKLYDLYTNVSHKDIFSVSPFVQRRKGDREFVSIDFVNTLWQFIKLKRTFGESKALKRNIRRNFTKEEYELIRKRAKKVV
jgi:predicted acylesterase/phospholipase RssA